MKAIQSNISVRCSVLANSRERLVECRLELTSPSLLALLNHSARRDVSGHMVVDASFEVSLFLPLARESGA
jgi:hypothetical protein